MGGDWSLNQPRSNGDVCRPWIAWRRPWSRRSGQHQAQDEGAEGNDAEAGSRNAATQEPSISRGKYSNSCTANFQKFSSWQRPQEQIPNYYLSQAYMFANKQVAAYGSKVLSAKQAHRSSPKVRHEKLTWEIQHGHENTLIDRVKMSPHLVEIPAPSIQYFPFKFWIFTPPPLSPLWRCLYFVFLVLTLPYLGRPFWTAPCIFKIIFLEPLSQLYLPCQDWEAEGKVIAMGSSSMTDVSWWSWISIAIFFISQLVDLNMCEFKFVCLFALSSASLKAFRDEIAAILNHLLFWCGGFGCNDMLWFVKTKCTCMN